MTIKYNIKLFSNVIAIGSLPFVIIYLINNNIFVKPAIQSLFSFFLSIFFLILGFLVDAFTIKIFLWSSNSLRIDFYSSLILTGKFILAKYIPGKMGVILGKTAYVDYLLKIGKVRSFEIITVYQILFLISASLLSIVPLYFFINHQSEHILILIGVILLLTVMISFKGTQILLRNFLNRLTKKNISITYSPISIFIAIFGSGLCWLFWAFGFWYLAKSVGIRISLVNALFFPFASIAGVLAIFSPGGLGVREGIITVGLLFFGHNKVDSINLSVYSRLWFLFGEVSIFVFTFSVSYLFGNKIDVKK